MKRQSGFTLIELVMVIVILGILGAIATPIFFDLETEAETAAKSGMSGAVKAAHAVAIARYKRFPTVQELADQVQGENVTAVGGGIQVVINGNNEVVPTYNDVSCTPANQTGGTGQTVRCVGSIP